MKRFVCMLTVVLFLVPILCRPTFAVGDKQSLEEQAKTAADRYLQGIKIVDLPEGKRILNETAWKVGEIPVLIDYNTIYEGMFDTDVVGLKGFNRILQVKLQSKAGTELSKRYILVAYKDISSGKWKVFDFRESADLEYEMNAAKSNIGDTQYIKDQHNYRNYAYWAVLAGKLRVAREAYQKAAEVNRSNPDSYVSQEAFDRNVEFISSIIPPNQ